MKFSPGIRFRLLVLGMLPATLLALVLTAWFVQQHLNELETSLIERGKIISTGLARASTYGVFSGNQSILQQLTDNLLRATDVVNVAVYDPEGNILASSSNERYEESDNEHGKAVNNSYFTSFNQPIVMIGLKPEENDLFNTLTNQSTDENRVIGEAVIVLSRIRTTQNQVRIIRTSLFITFIGLLISALLARRLAYLISHPVLAMNNTVREVSKGNFNARVDIETENELDELKEGLNEMAEALENNQKRLENKVKSATHELNLTLNSLEEKNRQLDSTRQQAVESNKMKSRFLAHMSHEIRTPMNGIIGFLQLLAKSPLSATQSNQVRLIDSSARNLLIIINEILDHSELEAGKLKLHVTLFDLRRCIEEAVALLSPLAHKKRLQLILLIDPDLPKTIESDPIRIKQILTNLVGNSLKFAFSGQIIVRIRIEKLLGTNKLLVSVSDSGCGIQEDDQENLFKPFSQLKGTASNNHQGTGLGLNISQHIVSTLGGEIGFVSKARIGTSFWFTVPLKHEGESEDETIQPENRHNILIFDHNNLSRRSLNQQLAALGETIIDVDKEEALLQQLGKNNPIDLMIVDYQTIQTVNRQIFANLQTPVLYTSNFSLVWEPALFLQRPCTKTELAEKISSILKFNHQPPNKLCRSFLPTKAIDCCFLIADDNEINRQLLSAQIESICGANTIEVSDGEEALFILEKRPFDLIFLDLRMPRMDGLTTLKNIKSRHSILNQNTPFIAVTAHLSDKNKIDLVNSGFSAIIIKPVLEQELTTVINRLITLPTKISVPSQQQTQTVFDFDELIKKVQGDSQVALTLIKKLIEELPELISQAEESFLVGNVSATKDLIHKIHGSACYFDIPDITRLSEKIESALDASEEETAGKFLPLLQKEIALFTERCSEILKKQL